MFIEISIKDTHQFFKLFNSCIVCHYAVAFFKTHLVGDTAWEVYLSQGYAEACEPDIAFYSEGETPGLVTPPCLH